MATNHDPIPERDSDFDTLQGVLITKATAKAVDWAIPAGEITKLTTKQAIWAAAWLIAKDKLNSTAAQKQAKTLARKNFEKVLRPFIQSWIYRNELVDDDGVMQCGLLPRDHEPTGAVKPAQPVAHIRRGQALELITDCDVIPGARHYGCILTENGQMPPQMTLTSDGKLIFVPDNAPGGAGITGLAADLTDQRVKHFTGLVHDATYYAYYYAVNNAGVSALSEPVSIVCW